MNPTPELLDNKKNESVKSSSEKTDAVKTFADSFHVEKKLETDVSINQQKSQVGLLGINTLANGITSNDANSFADQLDRKEDSKKSFTEKAGDFLRENKNIVGRAAGIGGGILAYSLFKKWRRKKEEKEAKEGKQPGFLKRTRRSLLGIGATAGAGWMGYKIALGLLNTTKDPNNTETDEFKNLPKDTQEKYNKIGASTDALYSSIFAAELQAGWQDDADMNEVSQRATGGKESLQGVVPFIADSKYSSIDNMMSYRGEYMSIVNDSIENISSKIVGLVSGTWGFLSNYFSLFRTPEEKNMSFMDWIQKNPKQHAQELKFFAREILRVQTYLLEKEKELVHKIAAQKFAVTGGFDTLEDAMDDDDWMQTNVYNSPVYSKFRSGKIIDAYATLESYGLLQGKISDETQDVVKQLDEERAEIIGDNGHTNGLQEIMNDLNDDGKIEQKTQQQMYKISQAVVKDMDTELLSTMKESFLSPIKELFNTDENALNDYLEKSGLLHAFNAIREGFQTFAQQVSEGKISPSDIKAFVNSVNTYTAWKKEAMVGSTTLQKITSDKEGFDYIVAVGGTAFEMMKNTLKGMNNLLDGKFSFNNFGYLFAGLTATGMCLYVSGSAVSVLSPTTGKMMKVAGTWSFKGGIAPLYLTYKGLQKSNFVARHFRGVYSGPAGLVRRMYFAGDKGPLQLWQKFESGAITLKQAEKIIQNGLSGTTNVRNSRYLMFPNSDNISVRLIEKKRGKLLVTNGVVDMNKVSLVAKYYDVGNVTTLMKSDYSKTLQQLESLSLAEATLTGERAMLFNAIKSQKKATVSMLDATAKILQQIDNAALQGMNVDVIAKTIISKPGTYASSAAFLNTLKALNVKEINYILTLDNAVWKNAKVGLQGNHLDLFTRCENEIDNLVADAKSYIAKDKKVATAKAKEIVGIKDFTQKINTLKQSEVAELLKIFGTEANHILSLKSFVFLTNNAQDVKKILSEVHAANKTGQITEDMIKAILAKDAALVERLQKSNMYDNIVKECFAFAGSTKTLASISNNIDILVKLLKIRF